MANNEMHINLAKDVEEILDKYGEDVRASLFEGLPNISKMVVKELRADSPKESKVSSVIHNKNKPYLTHLLNYGHKVANAKNGKKWVNGDMHITMAEDYAIGLMDDFVRECINDL